MGSGPAEQGLADRLPYAEVRAALLSSIEEARPMIAGLTDPMSELKLEEHCEDVAAWIQRIEEVLERYLRLWSGRFASEYPPQRVEDLKPTDAASLRTWPEGKVRTLEGMCEEDYEQP
jgi:hypothetical protein